MEFRLAMAGLAGGLTAIALPAGAVEVSTSDAAGATRAVTEPSMGVPGTIVRTSTSLTVAFPGPLDSFSVQVEDFRLERVSNDGSPARRVDLTESLDSTDPAGRRIVLNLAEPLASGHYRLLIVGQNRLAAADGTRLAGGGVDIEVGDFAVGGEGLNLAGATDLGTPTTTESVRSDRLDLAADPTAVRLYKVTLPEGHFWRLGLDVSARSDGGSLYSQLSLLDVNGRLISTAGQGRTAGASDPYLFAGLKPGTYYVAVSGVGVVPSTSGNLAPSPGEPDGGQPGGPFQLHLVADPADRATRVLGVRLDRADPESSAPTGLSVQFSGSIQEIGLGDPTRPAAVLVDAQGHSWGLTVVGYDEANARLSFALNQAIPAGHYTLALTGPGSLTDLAGLTPVASGRPPGVLGAVDITSSAPAPDDLGTLLPSLSTVGLKAPATVPPVGTVVEHFTVVRPGVYTVEVTGDPVRSRLVRHSADPSPSSVIGLTIDKSQGHVFLAVGTYSIILSNDGSAPADVTIQVRQDGSLAASTLDGGVVQGPALGLRAIAPSPDPTAGSPAATGPVSPVGPARSSATEATASTSSASAGIASPSASASPDGTSASFFLVGGPVGHPGSSSDSIGSVGPGVGATGLSIASNSAGLPTGLSRTPSPLGRSGGRRAATDPAAVSEGSLDRATELTSAAEASAGRGEVGTAGDRQALADSAWLDGVVAWTLDRLQAASMADPGPIAEAPAEVDPSGTGNEPPAEVASMASPAAFGILGMLLFRYRRNQQAKAKGGASTDRGVEPRPRSPLAGPHTTNRRGIRPH